MKKILIIFLVLAVVAILIILIPFSLYLKNEQIIKKAVSLQDASVCEKGFIEYFGSKCILKVAVAKKDETVCEKMTDESWKEGCVRAVAVAKGESFADVVARERAEAEKEVKYNVVGLLAEECVGCVNADFFLVGKVYLDNTVEELTSVENIIGSKYVICIKCMEFYEEKRIQREEEVGPNDFIDVYFLTEEEIEGIKTCIAEQEEADYCETTQDCCEGDPEEYECSWDCVNEACMKKSV